MKKANMRHQEITQKALDLGVLSTKALVEQYAKEAMSKRPKKSLNIPQAAGRARS